MQKTRILLILLLLLLGLAQTSRAASYYVDATKGNDSWSGNVAGGDFLPDGCEDDGNLSDCADGPWKTIKKANNYTSPQPGDSILFKRGEVWNERALKPVFSGSAGNAITFGAYGTGDKPRFKRSISASNASDWVDEGNNIWRLNYAFPASKLASAVFFDNDKSVGYEVWNESDLNAQGRWWSNDTARQMKMHSAGNPASYYANIEITLRENGIDIMNGTSNLRFENLWVDHVGEDGIMVRDDSSNITITNCDISYCGGGHEDGKTSRYGNGIDAAHRDANNIIVRYSRIWQVYDAGTSLQGFSANLSQYNIYIQYNIISQCGYCFEFWTDDEKGPHDVHDVHFENNVCYEAGGWSLNDSSSPDRGHHIKKWHSEGSVSDFYIRNNIFHTAYAKLVDWGYSEPGVAFVVDHNAYYPDGDDKFRKQATYNFTGWRSAARYDNNSQAADPLLASPQNNDFHLQPASPCIDAGADVSLFQDFEGNPIAGLPDIGAYEHMPSCIHKAEIPPCDGCVDMAELLHFIDRWTENSSDPKMGELMESIGLWKRECS